MTPHNSAGIKTACAFFYAGPYFSGLNVPAAKTRTDIAVAMDHTKSTHSKAPEFDRLPLKPLQPFFIDKRKRLFLHRLYHFHFFSGKIPAFIIVERRLIIPLNKIADTQLFCISFYFFY